MGTARRLCFTGRSRGAELCLDGKRYVTQSESKIYFILLGLLFSYSFLDLRSNGELSKPAGNYPPRDFYRKISGLEVGLSDEARRYLLGYCKRSPAASIEGIYEVAIRVKDLAKCHACLSQRIRVTKQI
jgi:hypothetical protein